ncbi:hypothetical protein [Actinophytocola sp.]|jgi:hypothetical protein|uniref:hypothetical protein n=1 Tax=Actinophytocola sp. TaxID=1872138 RepID=UPI002EDAA33D
MPRLATPANDERRHRKPPTERDRFLFVLKVATFVVATGLVGGFLLLNSGGGGGRATPVPTVSVPPETPAAGRLKQRPIPTTTTTTAPSQPVVVAPPVERTETAEVVPAPATPKPPQRPVPRPRQDARFVVEGAPCDPPGAYALTAQYQPMVCAPQDRTGKPTWQRVF